jgi:hypothetical protein
MHNKRDLVAVPVLVLVLVLGLVPVPVLPLANRILPLQHLRS